MSSIEQTASSVRRPKDLAKGATVTNNSAILAALALAAGGCSSERAIAHQSNQIVQTATSSRGRFVWIADESTRPSPNLAGINETARAGIEEQQTIIESAATIIYNLPGVRDVTPFWAELLVWALIAVSVVGVVIIAMQTGIPSMIGRFVQRWLPKPKSNA
jgi:hypothetical protein